MRYRVLTPEMMNRIQELKDIRINEIAVREREKKIFTWTPGKDDNNKWNYYMWTFYNPDLSDKVMRYKLMSDKETKKLACQVAETHYYGAYSLLKNRWRSFVHLNME